MGATAQTGKHILVATDGSEQSTEAARFVRSLTSPETIGRITVLAVIRPIVTTSFYTMEGISQEVWDSLSDAAQASAKDALKQTVDALAGFGPPVETLIRNGLPADEIIDAAKELNADLIVIGSRGLGEVRSVLLGSVSERVLHTAHCPVLIVRPPPRK
jgi:nucleotide-binding universal stress UspA family protein